MGAEDRVFVWTQRVGYADVDRMEFLHHSKYFVYFETARVEFLRSLGDSYKAWEDDGFYMPLLSAEASWRQPGRYDDLLEIRARLSTLTRARLSFAYEVLRPADGALIATAATHHAYMGRDGRPRRLSPERFAMLEGWLAG
ncbi:MAG: thioesterase family protein [Candidatus Sumerlaeia bacterium]|nr:thioesterase family protein [Candidatus Sumerlaeia bacterium]